MISHRSVDQFHHPGRDGRIHDHPTWSVHQGFIKEILSEDTVFQSTAVSTHIVQLIIRITLLFLLIGIPLNNLVTITCFPPLALPTIAAGAAACVSFATVVGEAAAGTIIGYSNIRIIRCNNRIIIGGWRSCCTTRGEKLDESRNDLCRCRIIRVSKYIVVWTMICANVVLSTITS